jgi:hypothetical protein
MGLAGLRMRTLTFAATENPRVTPKGSLAPVEIDPSVPFAVVSKEEAEELAALYQRTVETKRPDSPGLSLFLVFSHQTVPPPSSEPSAQAVSVPNKARGRGRKSSERSTASSHGRGKDTPVLVKRIRVEKKAIDEAIPVVKYEVLELSNQRQYEMPRPDRPYLHSFRSNESERTAEYDLVGPSFQPS